MACPCTDVCCVLLDIAAFSLGNLAKRDLRIKFSRKTQWNGITKPLCHQAKKLQIWYSTAPTRYRGIAAPPHPTKARTGTFVTAMTHHSFGLPVPTNWRSRRAATPLPYAFESKGWQILSHLFYLSILHQSPVLSFHTFIISLISLTAFPSSPVPLFISIAKEAHQRINRVLAYRHLTTR